MAPFTSLSWDFPFQFAVRHPDLHYFVTNYISMVPSCQKPSLSPSEPSSTQDPQSISAGQTLHPKESDTFPIFFITNVPEVNIGDWALVVSEVSAICLTQPPPPTLDLLCTTHIIISESPPGAVVLTRLCIVSTSRLMQLIMTCSLLSMVGGTVR